MELFNILNAKALLPLLQLEACLKIPSCESLERNWGELEIKGLPEQEGCEFKILGSVQYFPLTEEGVESGVKWASEEAEEFISGC